MVVSIYIATNSAGGFPFTTPFPAFIVSRFFDNGHSDWHEVIHHCSAFFGCFLKMLFIYFWLHWVFVVVHGLSLVMASGGYSLFQCTGFSLQWPLLLRSTGSRHVGLSSCGMQAQQLRLVGSTVQAQQLWCTGLVALWHVGSSQTGARTHVPCIGRQTPNHCSSREVPSLYF